jgi:hypothetical protein
MHNASPKWDYRSKKKSQYNKFKYLHIITDETLLRGVILFYVSAYCIQ